MISKRFLIESLSFSGDRADNMTDNAYADIGSLFLRYRKQRINPKTGKSWTLGDLSNEVSAQIQKQLNLSEKEGLSASSLSRLENGTLLPGRQKLKVLAEFLRIPDLELKPLIDLGEIGTSSHFLEQKEWGRVKALENKKQKTILDRLRLISYANMAGDYHSALEGAEEALLVLDSPYNLSQGTHPLESGVLRALLQSKKAYAQYWLETDKPVHLERSQEWAENADQLLQALTAQSQIQIDPWVLRLTQIETVRCLTTATQELFNHRYIQHAEYSPEEQARVLADYNHLDAILQRFQSQIKFSGADAEALSAEQQQFLTEIYLYFRREKDRLSFKWLEIMEAQALWQDPAIQQARGDIPSVRLDNLAALLYWQLKARPKPTLKILNELFTLQAEQLCFRPAADLQPHWQTLAEAMHETLNGHDQLEDPNPNKAYQEAVMLYPATLVRLGRFMPLVDLLYFKLIYMQTDNQTRATWYYIRALCYTLHYRISQEPADLELALQNWFKYAQGQLEPAECNQERFMALLGEAALWSTWLPLVHHKNLRTGPYTQWFVRVFEDIMQQPRYLRLKKKA